METKQPTPAGGDFVIKAVYRGIMSPPSAFINQYALYGGYPARSLPAYALFGIRGPIYISTLPELAKKPIVAMSGGPRHSTNYIF